MPIIDTQLVKNKSYINSGNFFSKGQIIKENINSYFAQIIIIENDKYLSEYKKIFSHLKINLSQIETINDLVNIRNNKTGIFFVLAENITKGILSDHYIKKELLSLNINEEISELKIIKILNDFGYSFSEFEKKGSYRKIGDIITIIDFNSIYKYQISFWGDKIETINREELFFGNKSKKEDLETLTIGSNKSIFIEEVNDNSLLESLKKGFCIIDSLDFTSNYNLIIDKLDNFCCFDLIGNKNLDIENLGIKDLNLETLDDLKETLLNSSYKKEIYTKNIILIKEFINFNNLENIDVGETKENNLKSYRIKKETIEKIVICDDVISNVFIKKRVKRKISNDIDLLLKIKSGDYIVHIDHGIGVFNGIIEKKLVSIGNNLSKQKEIIKEYIQINYKDNDKLFVPVTECSRISKYVGNENPKLTTLGSKEWEKKINKVNEEVQIIAEELLEAYAQRKISSGFAFNIDTEKIRAFQNTFPYTYTDDQFDAIEDILKDMSESKTMDRLLVGDVGFGKTEIGFNAVYNAFLSKKQVVFISPLVVLAYEHYEKALDRFKAVGMKIGVLTRLETVKKANDTIRRLKTGEIDLVIGTHKLLNESIEYKDLGLVIIDEEHKFGVKDKEKIKQLKTKVDLLSMSATPIPRSLNMALSSIRELSILKNAPMGRKSIKTYVTKYREEIIFDACEAEFKRGGQVFFIHNKIKNIEVYKKNLQKLFPTKKIIITHGQLEGIEMERRIIDFKHKKYDILLSTTVIENGIDFANVNTIFINECQNFGISQIHQLRGRVGRSERKGYCYLLYKKDNLGTETAKRLKTIVEYSYLGAGFELAMKDLEIRGSGDILGIRQSGQAKDIGVSLFIKMLEKKVDQLKDKQDKIVKDNIDIKIDLNIGASIPFEYFTSESDKLNFYREVESIETLEDLNNLILDFKKVNPNFTNDIKNLFEIIKLKIKASKFMIESIKKVGINYQIDFHKDITLDKLKEFLKLDEKVYFNVININRLRTTIKNFENDEMFLQYMLQLFDFKIKKMKIKLKSKNNIL